MQGFLNLNKPVGPTSHDMVAKVRRLVGRKLKVGHAGTLDPAASGILPIAIGAATRLIEYLADAEKGYRALVRLGATTTTDDAEGEIISTAPVPPLDAALVEAALVGFRGEIMQVPPMFSALHHEGQRLYDLARAGKHVDIPARPVTIHRLELAELAPPLLKLDITCSKGTYIRSLARDLGAALGCGAHLAGLERTFVGGFRLAQSVTWAELEAEPERIAEWILPIDLALNAWPALHLDAEGARRVRHGMPVDGGDPQAERMRAYAPDGTLLAVLERAGAQWRPTKVLQGAEQ